MIRSNKMNSGSYFYVPRHPASIGIDDKKVSETSNLKKKKFDYTNDDSIEYIISKNEVTYRRVSDLRGVQYYMLEEDLNIYDRTRDRRREYAHRNIFLPVIQTGKEKRTVGWTVFPKWEAPMPAGFLSIADSEQIVKLVITMYEDGTYFETFHRDIFKKEHDVYFIFDISTLKGNPRERNYVQIMNDLFEDFTGFVHVPEVYLTDENKVQQYFQRGQITKLDEVVSTNPDQFNFEFWSNLMVLPVEGSVAINVYQHVLTNYLKFVDHNIIDEFHFSYPGESLQTLQARLQITGLGGIRNVDMLYTQISNYNLKNIEYMLTKFRRPPKISNTIVNRIVDGMHTAVYKMQLLQAPMDIPDGVDSEIEVLFINLINTLNMQFVSDDVKNNLIKLLSDKFPDLTTYLQSM